MSKVLIIEDDPLVYHMYQKLFKLEGFEAEVAENGQVGLDKLNDFKADIILLDIMMPTMNGLEVLNQLKSGDNTKTIPVIILTNVADNSMTHMALEKGAILSLVKSQIDPSDVVDRVRSILVSETSQAEQV